MTEDSQKNRLTEKEWCEMIKEIDTNGDRVLSYQ